MRNKILSINVQLGSMKTIYINLSRTVTVTSCWRIWRGGGGLLTDCLRDGAVVTYWQTACVTWRWSLTDRLLAWRGGGHLLTDCLRDVAVVTYWQTACMTGRWSLTDRLLAWHCGCSEAKKIGNQLSWRTDFSINGLCTDKTPYKIKVNWWI